MVRRVLFSRVTKQSRKGILPFSSISLVNWMLVFCSFKCSWNSSCTQPHLHFTHLLIHVKGKDKPEDRPGAVYKIHCSDCQATYIGETGRNLTTRLTEHKRGTKNGDLNNNVAEHHLKTNHAIGWDSATCLTYCTDYYQRITLESWFTNLEQTALNHCQPLPAPYKRLLNRKQ